MPAAKAAFSDFVVAAPQAANTTRAAFTPAGRCR